MNRNFLFILLFLSACGSPEYPGFTKHSPELYYQRLELGEGISYHPDSCFVDYTVSYYPLNEASKKSLKMIKFEQFKASFLSDSILKNPKKGDRIKFITSNTQVYINELCHEEYAEENKKYEIELSVDEVYNLYLQEEDPNVLEYKSLKNFFYLISSPNLYHYYKGVWINWIEKNEAERTPVSGNIVLDYAGYSLENEARDIPDFALQFNIKDQYQVIQGIEYALSKMSFNDSVRVIIPSYLAFGELGSKNGNIPPYQPLMYYLKAYTPSDYIATHPNAKVN
jgi:hypothetical protein